MNDLICLMKNIIIFIVLILAFTACTSYSCPTYAQIIEPDTTNIEPNIEFNYFRIATIEPKKSLAMDFTGRIWITDKWLIIKSKSYSILSKRFNFISEARVKGARAWYASPQGEPYVKVYIEYSEGEYIIIFFVKSNIVTYFISEDVKYQFAPFKEYATWYEKMN